MVDRWLGGSRARSHRCEGGSTASGEGRQHFADASRSSASHRVGRPAAFLRTDVTHTDWCHWCCFAEYVIAQSSVGNLCRMRSTIPSKTQAPGRTAELLCRLREGRPRIKTSIGKSPSAVGTGWSRWRRLLQVVRDQGFLPARVADRAVALPPPERQAVHCGSTMVLSLVPRVCSLAAPTGRMGHPHGLRSCRSSLREPRPPLGTVVGALTGWVSEVVHGVSKADAVLAAVASPTPCSGHGVRAIPSSGGFPISMIYIYIQICE